MSTGKSDVVAYAPTFVSEGHGRPELWKGMQPDHAGEWAPLSLLLDALAQEKRWFDAYNTAWDQAMSNGCALQDERERAERAEALAGELQKDARRYRFLRDQCNHHKMIGATWILFSSEEAPDTAIDAIGGRVEG